MLLQPKEIPEFVGKKVKLYQELDLVIPVLNRNGIVEIGQK